MIRALAETLSFRPVRRLSAVTRGIGKARTRLCHAPPGQQRASFATPRLDGRASCRDDGRRRRFQSASIVPCNRPGDRATTCCRVAQAHGHEPRALFINEMAVAGMAEVQLGKLATERAANADVKAFGHMIVTDHSKAGDELKQIASQLKVQPPTQLDPKHRDLAERLSKLQGAAFDREYMDAMVQGPQEVLGKLRAQSVGSHAAGAPGSGQGEQALTQWDLHQCVSDRSPIVAPPAGCVLLSLDPKGQADAFARPSAASSAPRGCSAVAWHSPLRSRLPASRST